MFFLQGTNYRKTNAAMEMRLINRESFWARAEVSSSICFYMFASITKAIEVSFFLNIIVMYIWKTKV